MLISKNEYLRMAESLSLKSIADNTYLDDDKNDNFKWIAKQYYDNSAEKTKLLAVSTWTWKSVIDTISYYVWTPETEMDIELSEYIKDFSRLWYFTLWLKKVDGKLSVKYIPAEDFTDEGWVYRTYTFYKIENRDWLTWNIKYYVLEQQYVIWKNINTLYEVSNFTNITNSTGYAKVDLKTIFQTEHLKEVELTWLKTPSVFLTKIDNTKELKDQVSPLKSIKRNVYSIDRKATMVSNQFLQNVESFILMKDIEFPTKMIEESYNNWQKLDFKDLWRVINWRDTASIEFIQNNNALLQDSIAYEDNDIKIVSSLSKVPSDFLGGVTTEWAIWQGSRSLVHGAFIKMIWTFRLKLNPLLDELNVLFKVKSEYVWWDIFAKTDTELTAELKNARENGFVSQLTAIKQYLGFDDKQAQEELDKINNETILINVKPNESKDI